jgi:hypothetical protein
VIVEPLIQPAFSTQSSADVNYNPIGIPDYIDSLLKGSD